MAGIRYGGVRGNGRVDCGIADSSRAPADIAEELFREGWRKAAVEHDCEARTWKQPRAGGWGDSRLGWQRAAVTQVDGHWACRQHADHPPGERVELSFLRHGAAEGKEMRK
jgi:hypothetical protein